MNRAVRMHLLFFRTQSSPSDPAEGHRGLVIVQTSPQDKPRKQQRRWHSWFEREFTICVEWRILQEKMGSHSYSFSSSSALISDRNQQYQRRQQANRRSLFSRWSSGLISFSSGAPCPSIRSAFYGQSIQMPASLWVSARGSRNTRPVIMMSKPVIQFIQGMDEQTIPDVKLTKSRDGTNGVATFIFDQPSVFDSTSELGEITGLYMIDEEGVLQSVDVNAKFINGKPSRIEARYVMKSPQEWDRFMRFMERYSNENGLQFVKK